MKWPALEQHLPEPVAERCRPLAVRGPDPESVDLEGDYVVYWMRNAARAHENPAMDAAVAAGNELDRPAFVYHAVSEQHPYASDRHHTFALQGAREVSAECDDRGLGYALHVQREGHRDNHLRELCERAALVVVEDVPVDPVRRWHAALADRASTPVVAVDADCIVPMQLVGRLYDRPYKYRNAVSDLRSERIDRDWRDVEPDVGAFLPDDLPFEPVDIAETSIPELIAACDIDHAIGPVPNTPGGRTEGYARWESFRDDRLDTYHGTRNKPTYPGGASRMSPYLHWGHISPLRIARQATARDSDGAEKYIDEMVTWRELGHHFCFYDPNYGTVDALPDWALESLREHESDERPALYDWETLARGETDDELWNLCQRSLVRHGELHNNVRMTWAKKLLEWTPDIEHTLRYALDLNHRYSLDGSDPNSYLGIQWCYGAFDRPYDSDRPIIGKLRPRDTDWHAGRIDMDKYERIVSAPPVEDPPEVAIVGAGLAGSTCGRILRDHGLSVTAFDKGRGPGGRMSTRRADADGDSLHFDHGAQYFTARDERFRRHVDAWREQGLVEEWTGQIGVLKDGDVQLKESDTQRFVGTPKMNAVVRHLGEPLDPQFDVRVQEIRRHEGDWLLRDDDGDELGTFDALVVTPPAEQTAELLEGVDTPLRETVREVSMQPTWAAMLAFGDPLPVEFDGAFVHESPLAWVARNSSKPGRPEAECWMVHSTHEWAADHIEQPFDAIAEQLADLFLQEMGLEGDAPKLLHRSAHRWRYSEAVPPLEDEALFDSDLELAVAGDWVNGSRIEGAYLSGCAAAGRILGRLEGDETHPAPPIGATAPTS